MQVGSIKEMARSAGAVHARVREMQIEL
jgi:hypothetical protein